MISIKDISVVCSLTSKSEYDEYVDSQTLKKRESD